jgi:hypothetical protein
MSYARSFTVAITVSGNAGSGAFVFPKISGIIIKTIAIDAPGAAIYDWVLSDADGYPMTGETAASGDETYYVNLPMSASGSISMVNASNGTYNVKIWAEYN